MFQVRLEDCPGMADYIAKVQSIHGKLKELGIVFPEQAPAAALLVGLTSAYEDTRKMLLTLSAEDLTFAKRNRFPPCTYVVKYGNRMGQVCGGTNHPLATCFKKKDDEWYAIHGVDKKSPNWMRPRKANLVEAQDLAQASASDSPPADVRINLLFLCTAMINEATSQYIGSSQAPQYIEFTLDSGATHTVLKETLFFKPYATPIPLLGADSSFTTLAKVAAAPLDIVHMDVWGPAPVAARGGHRYFLAIVDDHSRYVSVHLLHTKAEAPEAIMAWVNQAQTTFGSKVKRLHSDGGGEFCNDKLKAFCSSLGILQNFTLSDSPQQNGIAESRNHTLVQIARCLLSHSNAPLSLWGYTLYHAALLYNLYPHPHLPDTTPTPLWLGKTPTARPLCVWRCTAYVLLNPQARRRQGGKLGPKTQTCIYLGHNADFPDYLFINPSTQQLVRSRDVVFDETRPFYSTSGGDPPSGPPSLVWADFDAPPELPPAPAPSPPTSPAIAPSPSEVSNPTSPVSSAAAPPSPPSTTLPTALPPPSAPITYHRRSNPPAPPPPHVPSSTQEPALPQPSKLITYQRRPIPPPKPPKPSPPGTPAPPSSPVAHGTRSHEAAPPLALAIRCSA
ncbi:unnamed protein product [Closterium sp. Naga37s-1]|nr:unnamed protein product [Closterium sp. Naga37s-1]